MLLQIFPDMSTMSGLKTPQPPPPQKKKKKVWGGLTRSSNDGWFAHEFEVPFGDQLSAAAATSEYAYCCLCLLDTLK